MTCEYCDQPVIRPPDSPARSHHMQCRRRYIAAQRNPHLLSAAQQIRDSLPQPVEEHITGSASIQFRFALDGAPYLLILRSIPPR